MTNNRNNHLETSPFILLTPKEIEVCRLLRGGRRSNEIASLLNISNLTVFTHRNRIRKKLGIANKHINLISYLSIFGNTLFKSV